MIICNTVCRTFYTYIKHINFSHICKIKIIWLFLYSKMFYSLTYVCTVIELNKYYRQRLKEIKNIKEGAYALILDVVIHFGIVVYWQCGQKPGHIASVGWECWFSIIAQMVDMARFSIISPRCRDMSSNNIRAV